MGRIKVTNPHVKYELILLNELVNVVNIVAMDTLLLLPRGVGDCWSALVLDEAGEALFFLLARFFLTAIFIFWIDDLITIG